MALTRRIIVDGRRPEEKLLQNGADLWLQQRINWKDPLAQIASTTVNFDIAGFPAGTLILGAFIRNITNWTGGAISAATLSLGTTASPAAYVAAVTVFAASAGKTLPGTTLVPGTFVNAATPLVGGTVRAQLLLTTANGNALLTGSADIFINVAAVKMYFAG
jgi:hypothetical protein